MSKYYIENGSYCTKVYIGTKANGKPKYKKLKAQTEKELDKRVKEFRKKIYNGYDLIKSSATLEEWAELFLEKLYQAVICEDCTLAEYNMTKARLNYFLEYADGLLAKTSLDKILSTDIQPAINLLFKENPYTGNKTAKRTIHRYIRVLKNVFEFARKMRAYNFVNPCDDVTVPKKAVEKKRKSINKYTIKLILTTKHKAQLAAIIFLLAGLRRGELTALTWDDIDFENKTINIDKSFDFKEYEIKEPKTDAGTRTVAISDYLCQILKDAKEESKSEYVIEKTRGGRMTESAWKRLFEYYMIALKEADKKYKEENECSADDVFEKFTPHILRHTYCSMLQWAGVDIKTAQELMGHNDYDVTANVYTHGDNDLKVAAASLQNEYLNNMLKTQKQA
ncbi:MAG: site-specific integrase [Clostridia bacterium]|nr:site-specific integrase [Clostridia bacterium]